MSEVTIVLLLLVLFFVLFAGFLLMLGSRIMRLIDGEDQ
jgi:hypothetical protein